MGLIASCSQEQDEPEVEAAISFGGNLQEGNEVVAGTRAEGDVPLSDLVQTFKVWAFKNMSVTNSDYGDPQVVMPGYTVNYLGGAHSTNSNSSGWEYVGQQPTNGLEQTIKYWDLNAKAYRFFAIAGGDGTYEGTESNGTHQFTLPMDGSTPEKAAATPYYSELWFKAATDWGEAHKQPVQLQFHTPFAKVRFMFRFTDPTLTRNSLMDVKFLPSSAITLTKENEEVTAVTVTESNNIAVKGTYTISYAITGTGTVMTGPTYAVDETDGNNDGVKDGYLTAFTQDYYETEETNDPLAEYWYYVLPYQESPGINPAASYTLTAVLNGETKTAVVPEQYMLWKRGYTYTYIFKVTEVDGIAFDEVQVFVNQWKTGGTKNHNVYNW